MGIIMWKQESLWYKFFFLFLIFLFPFLTRATTNSPSITDDVNTHKWRPILTLSAGDAFNASNGQSHHFSASSAIFSYYHYDPLHTMRTDFIGGIFGGAEVLLNPAWALQAGVAYYRPSFFLVQGTVTQGVDPSSDNQYAYHYTIQNHQLLIESKLLYLWGNVYPYLAVGLGASMNRFENFSIHIQPPFTTISNQFPNNTQTSFSYRIGTGVDVNMSQHIRLGLGYRFSDYGASTSGNGMIDTVTTNYYLSQSHRYTNEVLFQLTAVLS